MPSRTSTLGYLCITLAAVLWAVSGTSAKFLFHSGVSPFQLVQLRMVIASAALAGTFAAFRPALLKIECRDLPYLMLLGMAMAALQFTYLFTISKIHVAAAILLQYLGPVLIAGYVAAGRREHLSAATLTALFGATSGCYLVVGAYHLDMLALNRIGILSGLASAVAFAAYSLLGEFGARKYSAWTLLTYASGFGAICWNLLHPPFEAFRHAYTAASWGWILYIGVLGTAVPFGLYLKGVALVRATRASIAATLEPITAGVIAFLFLNERMEPLQILGGLMVVSAVVLLQVQKEGRVLPKPLSSAGPLPARQAK